MLKKTIKGSETSIFVGLAAAAVATLIGTVLGAVAGYYGRWVDDGLNWFYNVFSSIPYLLLILAVAAVLQQKGTMTIILILGLTGWTGVFRLIRAEYLKHKGREYVQAADAIGASNSRACSCTSSRTSRTWCSCSSRILAVGFIKAEVILSFLGFGVPVDVVSWGSMLERGAERADPRQVVAARRRGAPRWRCSSPRSACFTDALRDALDPEAQGTEGALGMTNRSDASPLHGRAGQHPRPARLVPPRPPQHLRGGPRHLVRHPAQHARSRWWASPAPARASPRSASWACCRPRTRSSHPGSEILYGGRNLVELSPRELRDLRGADISMIFQEPMTSLNPVFTVGYQLEEVLRLHRGLRGRAARKRSIELLDEVGIPDPSYKIDAFPSQMSGGQQQRVMIAMAIACEPKLLIADEPTTALDVTIQKQILDLIAELQRKHQMSVLFITHDLAVVGEIADQVVVMRHGEIREQGPAKAIFENPQDAYTKALLQCRPHLDRRPTRLPVIDDYMNAGHAGPKHMEERPRGVKAERPGHPRRPQPVEELLLARGAVRQARVQGGEGRLVQAAQGQDAGPRRRVGLGQDDRRPHADAAARGDRRRGALRGQGHPEDVRPRSS